MLFNSKGCLMRNAKLSLEKVILYLRNRKIQSNKFIVILHKFNKHLQNLPNQPSPKSSHIYPSDSKICKLFRWCSCWIKVWPSLYQHYSYCVQHLFEMCQSYLCSLVHQYFFHFVNSNVKNFYDLMPFLMPTQYGDGNLYLFLLKHHFQVISYQGWRAIHLPMRWRLYPIRYQTGISKNLCGSLMGKKNFPETF